MPSSRDRFPSPERYSRRPTMAKYPRSGSATYLLVLFGVVIIVFSLVLIGCAFTINYHGDFEVEGGGGLEAVVKSQLNYDQYWAGIPFLITGVLVLFSGIFQRSRGLTITTTIFCVIAIGLSLFVLSMGSGSFYVWNSMHRGKLYWDSKSGYTCETTGNGCQCTKSGASSQVILSIFQCDEISELSALFGSMIGSAIAVAMFSLGSIIVIVNSLSWKRIRYIDQRGYYPDDYHMSSGHPPSVVDMPYAKRGEAVETGPPYKQTIYRNYPY